MKGGPGILAGKGRGEGLSKKKEKGRGGVVKSPENARGPSIEGRRFEGRAAKKKADTRYVKIGGRS